MEERRVFREEKWLESAIGLLDFGDPVRGIRKFGENLPGRAPGKGSNTIGSGFMQRGLNPLKFAEGSLVDYIAGVQS